MSAAITPFIDVSEDLVLVRVEGVLELFGAQSIYGHLDKVIAERGYCLALFDLSKAALPTPACRRWIAHWFTQHDADRIALATFGTGLLVRTVNRMFDSVVSLLSGRPAPTRHFTSQTDARSWLDGRRSALRAMYHS